MRRWVWLRIREGMAPRNGLAAARDRTICSRIFGTMSTQAQDEGFALIENVVHSAQHFLRELGEFYPFAAIVGDDGKVRSYNLYVEDEDAQPEPMLAKLQELLEQDLTSRTIRGYAIGINVRAREPGETEIIDAVEIRLAHADLDPITYYMKYEGEGSDMRFFELFTL